MRGVVGAVLVGLVLWGCGSTTVGPDREETDAGQPAPECHPLTCEGAGKNCGAMLDGCGGTIECGACGEGQTCGGGGAANVCGNQACTPSTCEGEGKNCGRISDGCAAVLECGGCSEGLTCGGGGEANVCGSSSQVCTPTTCAAEGKNCGELSDGCGGSLQCGSCGEGETCGGGGTENVCGAPAESRIQWLTVLDGAGTQEATGLGLDNRGGLLAGVHVGDQRLARYDASGALTWSIGSPSTAQQVDVTYRQFVAASDGAGFLALGGSNALSGGPVIDQLRSNGSGATRLESWGDTVGIQDLVGDGASGYAYLRGTADEGDWVRIHRPDGAEPSYQPAPVDGSEEDHSLTALARAKDGSLLVGGTFSKPTHVGGGTVIGAAGRTVLAILELTETGELLWAREYPTAGRVADLGISSKGTVVAVLDTREPITFAGQAVAPGTLLVALEADGSDRWARPLLGRVEQTRFPSLAVQPEGEAIALTTDGCGVMRVTRFDLGGHPLWTHTLRAASCASLTDLYVSGIVSLDGQAVLAGAFGSKVDFGDGKPRTPSGVDGFLLNLGR